MPDNIETVEWPPLGAAPECATAYLFRARRFGIRQSDLDIEFSAAQPRVAAEVLSACLSIGGAVEVETVLQWTLKKRLQGLLAVYGVTFGDELVVDARCTHDDCGEWLQFPLSMPAFVETAGDDDSIIHAPDDKTRLRLRLPTGVDQLLWLEQRPVRTLFGSMAATLVLEVNQGAPGPDFYVPEQWLSGLEALLEQHDPLTALQIDTVCACCGREFSIALDLERQILARFARLQQSLLEEVHMLASAYHWSERDIMDLTPVRRQWYLQKLDRAWPV